MVKIYKKILASEVVWRISGISLATSIMATRGIYMNKGRYIEHSLKKVKLLGVPIDNRRVFELGTGVGGNLISIANRIESGVGLDINKLFLYHARNLARAFHADNVKFLWYDGITFPHLDKFDVIFSINVFERIPKNNALKILDQLIPLLDHNSILKIFFLSERARGTDFTKLLGDNAYVYWNLSELQEIFLHYERLNDIKIKEFGEFEKNALLVTAYRN